MSRGRIVPISRPLLVGAAAPVDLLRRMRASGEECFLLESVEGAEAVARYSFLGVAPSARLTARAGRVEIEREGKRRESRVPLLEALDALTLRERYEPDPDLPPFCGGSVGYLSYDAARLFETLPDRHPRVSGMPDALFLRFDAVVAFDHARNRVLAITTAEESDGSRAEERLDRIANVVMTDLRPDPLPAGRGSGSAPAFAPAMAKEDFLGAVAAAKEAILAGEVYQVVLSQRWTARLSGDPLDVYEQLRALNPSPYL